MSSLAEKYDYLEKLTRKVSHSQNQQPKKRAYVPLRGSTDGDSNPAKKKKKNKQKQTKGGNQNTSEKKSTSKIAQKPAQRQNSAAVQNGAQDKVQHGNKQKMTQKTEGSKSEEFIAVDILRQRLHQKIEESRGQGPPKDPTSEEVLKRRAKRKQERERKKRKIKEFRIKKLAEDGAIKIKEEETEQAPEPQVDTTASNAAGREKDTISIVFNKVEVGEEYMDKASKLKEKKRRIKGAITPLTGRNYKQLLSRVEARKARLEELREKDEKKAKKEEEKMRWTNVLYKAEGMKIKDNEDLLRASLKRKEKMKAQRKKKWAQRSQQVLEKMQHRQDKRRKNIQRSKQGKTEKRKQKARKKGRVLPEDLKKVAL